MHSLHFHRMDTELIAERRTVRYTCPTCQRCVEDGPDGLRVLHKGDLSVGHRGGSLDIEQDEPAAVVETPPTLH
jgi:hypothetical protein